MRHERFDIAYLTIEGIDIPLKAAYLLVVDADDGDIPQWEVLAYALGTNPLEQRVHPVTIRTLGGAVFEGDAAVVRSVDGAHVLRGAGDLVGFDGFDD